MKAFRVWVSRMDGASGLRVDGLDNTTWLLRRLSGFFVFKTSEPLGERANSSAYSFRVAHNSQMSGPGLEKLLAGFREVTVIFEPAQRALAVE